jgi:hypothetical protein
MKMAFFEKASEMYEDPSSRWTGHLEVSGLKSSTSKDTKKMSLVGPGKGWEQFALQP